MEIKKKLNSPSMKKYILNSVYVIIIIAVIINLTSYFYLTNEDAYIGFQYVRNFANGHGFVINPGGTTQEGFSNLAIVVITGLLNKLFNFEIMYTSKILGILSTLAVLLLNFQIFKLLLGLINTRHQRFCLHALNLGSIITIGFSSYVALWSTQGLETMSYAAVVMLIAYLVLYSILKRKYDYFNLIAAVSFLSLTIRPEGLINFPVFIGIIVVWMIINRTCSKEILKKLATSIAIFVILMAAFITWKIWYFGDFISNPTYVKLSLKVWAPIFKYTFDYFVTKGAVFSTAIILCVIGALTLGMQTIIRQKNQKFTIFLVTIVAFLASQIFFTIYSRGDYMGYFRFFVTHYPIMVLLILTAPLILVYLFKPKYIREIIIVSTLILSSSIVFNEKIQNPTWKERAYISPHEAVKETTQYQISERLNGILKEDELYATSEYGIIPYYTNAVGLDMAGLNEKIVARTFRAYDINNTTFAIRDFVLSEKPQAIITWGHYLDENGKVIIDPGVAWFFGKYFDSEFFLKNYEINTPEKEGEWGIHIWNNSYLATDVITQKDSSNYDKLMFGFYIEKDQIWAQPLSRVMLEPNEDQTEIVIKGFIPDINAYQNKQNTIEIRYNNMAVGNGLLLSNVINQSGSFEIRSKFAKDIFKPNEGALITIKADSFTPEGDQRALSFILESIKFE